MYDLKKIEKLCDGVRSSRDIAALTGYPQKYIQAVTLKNDWPRRYRGSASGKLNGHYKFGRSIDHDGYVLVPATLAHPNARRCKGDLTGIMLEHRRAMEAHLGRYLEKAEVVDHVDGCHLHNAIENLRLFSSNGDHLRSTISGRVPSWSPRGFLNIKSYRLPKDRQRVDTHDQRKKLGEVRLLQILLAHARLDKESPYLLGTHGYLEKAEIDYSSRSKIELAVTSLYLKWELDPKPFLLKMNL